MVSIPALVVALVFIFIVIFLVGYFYMVFTMRRRGAPSRGLAGRERVRNGPYNHAVNAHFQIAQHNVVFQQPSQVDLAAHGALPARDLSDEELRLRNSARRHRKRKRRGLSREQIDASAPEVIHEKAPAVDDRTVDSSEEDSTSSDTDVEAALEPCPVCLEPIVVGERMRVLPCGHGFHSDCVSTWLAKVNRCPLCVTRVCSRRAHREAVRAREAEEAARAHDAPQPDSPPSVELAPESSTNVTV